MKRALALVLGLSTFAAARAANATVLWRGDFETGDKSQWSKVQEVSPDRLKVVTDPVRQGKYALRVEVRQGDDPINASGNRNELVYSVPEKEGNERYYAWSTMWPASYPSNKTWQLFAQFHHTGLTGSPPLEMYVNGETMFMRVNAMDVVWQTALDRGPWHDFILHVKWSSNATIGFTELWYDGKLVLPKTFGRNMYAGDDNYLKLGLYRNETITQVGVLFHDGMTVATALSDVQPADAGVPSSDAGDAAIADTTATDGATGDVTAASDVAPDTQTASDAAAQSDGSEQDAATEDDAATDPAASTADSEGCSCSAAGATPAAPSASFAALLLAFAGIARRRARSEA